MTRKDMPLFLRRRTLLTLLMPVFIIGMLLWSDPDPDMATTRGLLLRIITIVLGVTMAHITLKAIFDYPEADKRGLFQKAIGDELHPPSLPAAVTLAAQVLLLCVLVLAFTSKANAQDVRTFVPARCLENLKVLKPEQHRFWGDHPSPANLAALIEHESCISLKHSRCCNKDSRLRTPREEGANVLQITRAFRADGSTRFDALAELKALHPRELGEWSWDNVYQRIDLANRGLVLKSRDNFQYFIKYAATPGDALDFADGGYNAGNARLLSDRRQCGMSAGCNPRKYRGNVERFCTASREPIYGGRSACDIYHHHVDDVRVVRSPKYKELMA